MVTSRDIVAENRLERKNQHMLVKLLGLSLSEMHTKQTQIKKWN